MKLGVLVLLTETGMEEKIAKLREMNFDSCQLCGWNPELFNDENAEMVNLACKKYNVTISTFWCGWSGPSIWNFYEGPHTLGLVPPDYRFVRMKELMKGSDFAKKLGVVNVATHVGFLPENPNTTEYHSIVTALRQVVGYYKKNSQYFLFETGQETPVTLRRTIEDIGLDNIGVNFDTANLILYGKAHPLDAIDILGKYVRDIHAKDGCYPTDGKYLGEEKAIGDGIVNFPAFVEKLKKIGYDGPITIEREIHGDEQIRDILKAQELLGKLI
ncbi:MAG: sugar phosphate isomerase/epimerase [Clostridia bacterium]|nr:sugar phosphate isomerase/epimerase [Clostridia bacterium]